MRLGRHQGNLRTLGVIAAAIALAIPGSASAQRGGGGGGGFPNSTGIRLWVALDQRFEALAKGLSLTEAQTESVTRLVAKFREENRGALGQWAEVMASGRPRTGPPGGGANRPEAGGGMQRMREMRDLMRRLAPALEILRQEVAGLLDDEQIKTLATILERRPPRR